MTSGSGVALTARPRARARAEAVLVDGEAVVHAAGSVHLLNPTATLVWQCCDGDVSIRELADELADVFGAARADVERDALAIVTDLVERELVTLEESSEREVVERLQVLAPTQVCGSCGNGPAFEEQVLVGVEGGAITIGADRDLADAIAASFGPRVVGRLDDPGDEPPYYGVVLPRGTSGAPVGGARPLARLHRGPALCCSSRDPERVVRALVAQVATHLRPDGHARLDAMVVGRPGAVAVVPVPENRAAFRHAAARAGLSCADVPVAVVSATGGKVVVGAPHLDVDLAPLLAEASRRLHLGAEPAALPWGVHAVAALAIPGPASAANVLAQLGPSRDADDAALALDALLALTRDVTVVGDATPEAIAAALPRGG